MPIEATDYFLYEGLSFWEGDEPCYENPYTMEEIYADDRYALYSRWFRMPVPLTEESIAERLARPTEIKGVIDDKTAIALGLPATEAWVRICGLFNRQEVELLKAEIGYWKRRSPNLPNKSEVTLRLTFLTGVYEKFKEWYTRNGFDITDGRSICNQLGHGDLRLEWIKGKLTLAGSSDQNSTECATPTSTSSTQPGQGPPVMPRLTPRLTLSPIQREELNQDIYDAVQEQTDQGKTMEQAFHAVAANSVKLFGRTLSKAAVEGRYKRWKEH